MKSIEEIKGFAAQMRRVKTPAEQTAYNQLKDSFQATGVGFKNQVVFGFYILDFVVPSKMALIELDGSAHYGRESYDAKRDDFCRSCGLTVIRLHNAQASTLMDALKSLPFVPNWLDKWRIAKNSASQKRSYAEDPNFGKKKERPIKAARRGRRKTPFAGEVKPKAAPVILSPAELAKQAWDNAKKPSVNYPPHIMAQINKRKRP